jgi:hypothetical protein
MTNNNQPIEEQVTDDELAKEMEEFANEEAIKEKKKLAETQKKLEEEQKKGAEGENGLDELLKETYPINLAEVHKTIKKWLFISDTNLIDIILAVILTNQKKGTPVWMFIVDQSGELKTELLRTIYNLENVIVVSDLSVKGFVSGNPTAKDLFSQIKGKNVIIVIPDLANLSSKRRDEKNEIWAKFRDMFDGVLSRITGMDSKECLNAHVTLIGGATPNFRSQYIINNQLGTRELLYTPRQRTKYLKEKLDKAMENDNYEGDMRQEIADIVEAFLKSKKLKTIPNLDEDVNEFLKKQVKKLRIIRATAQIDYYSGAIIGEINIETPTRAIKQLKRLYEGLMSLDDNYEKERALKIIKRVIDSSGNQLRMKIMHIFEEKVGKEFKIADISNIVRAHKKPVKIELDFLWQLGWLQKIVRKERIGGYPIIDRNGEIERDEDGNVVMKSGIIKDIPYYWKDK